MIEEISQTIIQLLHGLLILYIILVPWINRPQQLFVIQILITIVLRWITNQDACFLTYFEMCKCMHHQVSFLFVRRKPLFLLLKLTEIFEQYLMLFL